MITSNVVYVFSGAVFLNGMTMFVFWPYKDKVHYLGMIFNYIGIFFNIGWVIAQEYVILTKYCEEIIAFVNAALIGVIVVWSFCRIIFEIRNKRLLAISTEKANKNTKKKVNKKMEADEMRKIILK
jgi:amino acid permease